MTDYKALDSTINIVAYGGTLDPDSWKQRHVDLFEYVVKTAATLKRFERGGCFVSMSDYNLKSLTYPNFRIEPMAKKETKSDSKMGSWNGIATVPFNSPEKEQFQKWQVDQDDWETDLTELIAQDYKLSLSHDNRSGAIMASLSCYNPKEPNYKYTLISRAPTPLLAVAVTLFKHLELSGGDWNAAQPEDADLWG